MGKEIEKRDDRRNNMDEDDGEYDDSSVEVSEVESELGSAGVFLLVQLRIHEDISSPHLHVAESNSSEEVADVTVLGGMQPDTRADLGADFFDTGW